MTEEFKAIESEQDLVKVRDEVFRKIGRNLLKFQNIEHLLKAIITTSSFSGFVSELENNFLRRKEDVHTKTMGLLIKQYLENTYSDNNQSAKLDSEITEAYFSTKLSFSADAEYLEMKKQSLQSLVEDRNNLVHHLLLKIDLHSVESCLEMSEYLDHQREKQNVEEEELKSILKNISDAWAELKVFYDSEEGLKSIELSFLQSSSVVTALCELSTSIARPDGWALLDNVGRELHTTMPDEISKLKKKYKSLKEIILACELFELGIEATPKDGTRVLYRLKPELNQTLH